MNALSKFLLPAAICLLLTSCLFGGRRDEEPKPTRSYNVSDSIRTLFLYAPGTIWYYSDSATGEPVRMIIQGINHDRYTYEYDQEFADQEEYYVYGSLVHAPSSGLDTAGVQFELRMRGMAFGYHNFKVRDRYVAFGLYLLGMLKADKVYSGGETSVYLPATNIRGRNYDEVYHLSFIDYKDEYWLTEKEGIVKMHLRHPDEASLDRIYELDSCRIIR